ncbi:MAG TPA: hypothetical protein VJS44_10310 [Pyrinomonadaceae bacterium]|nr:hypothetical protein [Pyrinomonadaceae bacterium]
MKGTERRSYEMFVRVDNYMEARAANFPPESMAGQLRASLHAEIDIIEDKAAEQSMGLRMKEEGTALRGSARENLNDQLEAIARTAVSIGRSGTAPGIETRFRMPQGNNDQTLMNTARAFAENALPIKGRFIIFGMPADFLDNLDSGITQVEQAINKQNSGKDMHVAATTAIDEAIERAMNIVRQLDAIIRNKYADDEPQLSAWKSARHIARSPRRSTEEEEEPTP